MILHKISFTLFFIILVFCVKGFPQSTQFNELETAKKRLEQLQRQIWQIEAEGEKEKEIKQEQLNKEAETKDEFETTKQFEERQSKIYNKIPSILDEIEEKTEQRKNFVLQKINEIQRNKFVGNFNVSLGQYNADKQVFPLFLDNGSYEFLFVPITDAKVFKEKFSEAEVNALIGLIIDENNQAKEYIINTNIKFRGKIYKTLIGLSLFEKI